MIAKRYESETAFVRAQVRGDVDPAHVWTVLKAADELGISKQAVGHALTYGQLVGWRVGRRAYVDARSARRYAAERKKRISKLATRKG